ncbi:Tox-REase-5 domain-containing protein [Nocardia jejuensis]|uniref:Tox-REase-5 domain-containing protein n=1 Tax=Nocardia jejuensis TaxID=328049 RepID=UPI000834B070|nr:Tox-REase-5 domain-containing protein [Nocardia jejuensis]
MIAIALFLLAGAVVWMVLPRTIEGEAVRSVEATAHQDLALGQLAMAQAPGQHYTGSLRTVGGRDIQVDLEISQSGCATGTVTENGISAKYYGVNGMAFLQAPSAFWTAAGRTSDDAEKLAGQWAKVAADYFGIDFSTELAPSKLALAVHDEGQVGVGKPVDINGRWSVPFSSGAYTVYVAVDKDWPGTSKSVLPSGVSSSGSAVPTSSGGAPRASTSPPITTSVLPPTPGDRLWSDHRIQPADFHRQPPALPQPAATPGEITRIDVDQQASLNRKLGTFTLDTSAMTRSRTQSMLDQMAQIGRTDLISAVDTDVRLTVQGKVDLAPCTEYSCVANATLTNTVSGSAADMKSVYATLTFTFTLDSAFVGSCSQQIQMAPNASGTASCPVSYSVPADGRMHSVEVKVQSEVRALVPEQVQQILQIVADNGDRLRAIPAPDQIGQWTVENIAHSEKSAPYQSQITGLPASIEYTVNGVRFDGYDQNGTLLDAKGPSYQKFFERGPDGRWRPKPWFKASSYGKLLTEARNQVQAAGGRRIEWHVADQDAAAALQQLFVDEQIDGIVVAYTPPA